MKPLSVERAQEIERNLQTIMPTSPEHANGEGDRGRELPSPAEVDDGEDHDSGPAERGTQAQTLIRLAQAQAILFRTPDGKPYAEVSRGGHRETWPLRSRDFRKFIVQAFFKATGTSPSSEAMKAALGTLEAMADTGPVHDVFMRVASHGGSIYVDLCDQDWRAVEVSAAGWKVMGQSPVRFRRAPGMLSLPVPTEGGTIEELAQHINVSNDDDFVLVVAWLLGALAPMQNAGTYPVIAVSGEHGAAKSTLLGFLRALIDPNAVPLRALPREERDLHVSANAGFAMAFDNVSKLPDWLSDAFCRIASGGGLALRTLFADDEETLFFAKRPQMFNGIPDVVERPDLADRSIFLHLAPIPKEKRMTEEAVRKAFEGDRPKILGALFNIVAHGLAQLPTTKLNCLPRMADFARWVVACEGAFTKEGRSRFLDVYERRASEAAKLVIEGDAVADAVKAMMTTCDKWEGTASKLLNELAGNIDEERRRNGWPRAANALTGRLRRLAPGLRQEGIHIADGRANSARRLTITKTEPPEN
jgi:hypothetical protein